ncbi:MAG: hypothetical protein NTV23_00315 [Propionibacteriales bacterium]|nr:hypothetical protein [Propionibacteriales bacterium]
MAIVLAGLVISPTASAATLTAPSPRYYTNSSATYVHGLGARAGVAKYQILKLTNNGYVVVKTVTPADTVSFVASGFTRVRAVDANGRPGPMSIGVPLNDLPSEHWEANYPLNRVNLSAYAQAVVKFLANRGAGCLKDAAFKAIYDKAVKVAQQSKNVYVASAGAIAGYYAKLYNMAFDNGCDELKVAGKYLAGLGASALTVRSTPITMFVQSSYVRVRFAPDYCSYGFYAYGGDPSIAKPGSVLFRKRISVDDCKETSKRWY